MALLLKPRNRDLTSCVVFALSVLILLRAGTTQHADAEPARWPPGTPQARAAAAHRLVTQPASDALSAALWASAPGSDLDSLMSRLRASHAISVSRAIGLLDTRFDTFRGGAGGFAEDVTSWSIRGKLAWYSLADFFRDANRRDTLVRERYAARVMSDSQLRAAVKESIDRLALEFRADRARFLAQVRGRIEPGHPESVRSAPSEISAALDALEQELDQAVARTGSKSLVMAAASLVGSTLAAEVAVSAAAGAGAAAAGGTAGAGAGSIVPGVGTAVGLATGLAAGFAVDWWLSDSFRESLTKTCRSGVDATRDALVEGHAAGPLHGTAGRASAPWPGLRKLFEEAAEADAQRMESLLKSMLKDEGP